MDETVAQSIENITLKDLLEAGVHFGHKKERWNPKFQKFIYREKTGIHIIDINQTLERLKIATEVVRQVVENGQDVVFVSTKQQSKEIIKEEAERAGAFYVNERWVGGLLTNFETISKSIARYREMEQFVQEKRIEELPDKDKIKMLREYNKLRKLYQGIKNMDSLPGLLYIIDPVKEAIPVAEARKMGIPTIALIDTNGDPDVIDYPIPGNDDAIKPIKIITSVIANVILESKKLFETKLERRE